MDDGNKSALRAEVELLTRVYLEGGGKIEKVPTGKGSLVEMTAQERLRAFYFHRPKSSERPQTAPRPATFRDDAGALLVVGPGCATKCER